MAKLTVTALTPDDDANAFDEVDERADVKPLTDGLVAWFQDGKAWVVSDLRVYHRADAVLALDEVDGSIVRLGLAQLERSMGVPLAVLEEMWTHYREVMLASGKRPRLSEFENTVSAVINDMRTKNDHIQP